MSGNRITDKNDMESVITTDRTQANSKQEKENVLNELKRLKEYGIEFIIKSEYPLRYNIYQAHTIKNGQPIEKQFSYIGIEKTLSDLHGFLGNLCGMFQDKYIFEYENINDHQRFTWELVEVKKI